MSNLESSFREDPEALIDLLEDIVASYQDNDSSPDDAFQPGPQRVRSARNYHVELAERFVVVDGGVSHQPTARWVNIVGGPPSSLSRRPARPRDGAFVAGVVRFLLAAVIQALHS